MAGHTHMFFQLMTLPWGAESLLHCRLYRVRRIQARWMALP
jgi:hypothetical protein